MLKKPCLKFPKSATYIFWIEKEEKEEKEEEWLQSTREGGGAGRHWGWHLVLHCTTVSAF